MPVIIEHADQQHSHKASTSGIPADSSRSYTSHSVATNKYTLEDICRDVRRLISNAKKYNQSGSIVYQHALALDRALRRAVKQVEELNLDYAEDDDSEEETALWSGCLQLRAELEAEEAANARELQEVLLQKQARESMFKPHRTHKQVRWEEVAKAAPDDADLLCRGAESISLHHARKLGRHPFIGPYGRMADSWMHIQPYSSSGPQAPDSPMPHTDSQAASNGESTNTSSPQQQQQQQFSRRRRRAAAAPAASPGGTRAQTATGPQWAHWADHTPAAEWPVGTLRNPQDTEATAGSLWRRAWLKQAQSLAAGISARGLQAKQEFLAAADESSAHRSSDADIWGVAYLRLRLSGELSAPLRAIMPAGCVSTPALAGISPLLAKGPLADKEMDASVQVGGINFPSSPKATFHRRAMASSSGAWRYDAPLDFGREPPAQPIVSAMSPSFAALLQACGSSSASAAAGLSIDVTPVKRRQSDASSSVGLDGLLTPSFRSTSAVTSASGFRARGAYDASTSALSRTSPSRAPKNAEAPPLGWDPEHTALWRHQYMQGMVRVHKCRVQAAGSAASLAAAQREQAEAVLCCTDAAVAAATSNRLAVQYSVPSAATETHHAAGSSKYTAGALQRPWARAVQGLLKDEAANQTTSVDSMHADNLQRYILVEWNPRVESGVLYDSPCGTPAPPSAELATAFAHDKPVQRLQWSASTQDDSASQQHSVVDTAALAAEGPSAKHTGAADDSTPIPAVVGRKGMKRRRSSVSDASAGSAVASSDTPRSSELAASGKAASSKGKGGGNKGKTTHKRMQLQDVWGVEGLLVYCHGSGRSAKHLRVGALFGGRIACFCGCSKLYSGSGFAQHTDNTKHRPLQTVFLLGTKMRLQDALREVRDSGASPQDLQSRDIAGQGVAMVQELYAQPGMEVPKASPAPAAPTRKSPEPAQVNESAAVETFRRTSPSELRAVFSTDTRSLQVGPMDDTLTTLDEDHDFFVGGLAESALGDADDAFLNFDSVLSSRASSPQLPEQVSTATTFVPSACLRASPSASAAVNAARAALVKAHGSGPSASATADGSGHSNEKSRKESTQDESYSDKTAHLRQQHPLADVVPVSLALAEAIIGQHPHNGVTPFSSLSAEDVEPEKLRKVGLASPSSSFSVHVLHTQLFSSDQRVAAACAAAALVPEQLLHERGKVPLVVAPHMGRRSTAPPPDAFSITPAPKVEKVHASTADPEVAPAAAPEASPSLITSAPPQNKKPRTSQSSKTALASQHDSDGTGSPSPRATAKTPGTLSVDVSHVDFTVSQAEQIELKAHPQTLHEDSDAVSLTLPVWVPLRAPAAVLARHRGLLPDAYEEIPGSAFVPARAKLTQLPLVLRVGAHIDCLFQGQWWDAVVRRLSGDAGAWAGSRRGKEAAGLQASEVWGVMVHYVGWSSKHDEWVVGDLDMVNKFAPLGTYTDPLKLLT